MEIQQHDGVVVVEERGNPAGLRQAPRERRRCHGREGGARGSGVDALPLLHYI